MNLNEAKELLENNGYLVESTKTEIDCSNWHWIKSMSSYNNNYYYDTLSNDEFYLEECDEDYGDYLYYACDKSGKKIKYLGYTNSEGSVENCNGKLVLDTSMPNLREAKELLEDNGYMINEETHYDHDARIDTSKLETKLKEMEQDLKIFSRIGAMIVAYFDREYSVKAECQAIEAIEDDREHVWHIHVWTDSDVDLEINVIDYNDMTLWIEYSVFGKEGGVEAQYSDAKYADLIKTKGSYMNVIDDLIKEGEE